tara:strand:- start:52 stop:648 length:597 start_codon:yes stop_codon:yes gene_type:complete
VAMMKSKYLIPLTSLLLPNLAFAATSSDINSLIFLAAIIFSFAYLFFRKKYKKEADIVGAKLHEQVISALGENEELASKRLNSPFVAGYIYSFTSMAFIGLIPSSNRTEFADEIAGKYIKYICNGIYPKKLWKIFKAQLTLIEKGKEMSISKPGEDFELGGNVGMWDGANITNWEGDLSRTNLKSYLLNKKLKYKEPK